MLSVASRFDKTKEEMRELISCIFEVSKAKYKTRIDTTQPGYFRGKRHEIDNKYYYIILSNTSMIKLRPHMERTMTVDKIKSFYGDLKVIDTLSNITLRYLNNTKKLNASFTKMTLNEFILEAKVQQFLSKMLNYIDKEDSLVIKKNYLYSHDYELYSINVNTVLTIRKRKNPSDPWLLELRRKIFSDNTDRERKSKPQRKNMINDTLVSIIMGDIATLRKTICRNSKDRDTMAISMQALMGALEILGKFSTYTIKEKKLPIDIMTSQAEFDNTGLLLKTLETTFMIDNKDLIATKLSINKNKDGESRFLFSINDKPIIENKRDLPKGYRFMVKEIYNDEVDEDLQDSITEENVINEDIDGEDEEWDNEF